MRQDEFDLILEMAKALCSLVTGVRRKRLEGLIRAMEKDELLIL